MSIRLTLLFILMACCAKAQISGIVTDEKKQPMPGAVIRTDRGIVKITDNEGRFIFNQPAKYLITSFTGYYNDTTRLVKEELIIRLSPVSQTLSEVKIKAKAPLIRQLAGKTIITVNDQVKKLADNALEIVALAPGLDIGDQENTITLSGKKSVQVRINDKPVQMTMADLAKYLKSLPSGTVKSVELMKEPPARYEADGQTGIINVMTVTLKGLTGNLDASSSQSRYNWSDISGVLNFGTDRFAISSYLAWHRGGYFTRKTRERYLSGGNLAQQTSNLEHWSDPVIRLTTDYQLTKNKVIGAVYEHEASTNTTTYQTNSFIPGGLTELTNGRTPYTRRWDTYNVNYRHGEALTIDLDKALFNRTGYTAIDNQGAPDISFLQNNEIDITTLKTDVVKTLHNLKLEGGGKFASVGSKQTLNEDRFHYQENTYAVYSSLSQNQGSFSWQLGLRAEYTTAKGAADRQGQPLVAAPDTVYLNLLPSLFINYAAGDRHQFQFSLSRRMQRPDYTDLAPFTYQIDPLNSQSGNPYLRTQRNDAAELSYTYNNRLNISAAYRRSTGYFNPLIRQMGNVWIQTTGNAGTMKSWGFDLNYPARVSKWWNMQNKLNVADNRFDGTLFQGALTVGQWQWSASSVQRLTLPGKYLVVLTARYRSQSRDLIYEQSAMGTLSASLGKKLANDRLSIRAGISDIFNTTNNVTRVNFGTLSYADEETVESRRVSLSVSWRFGNQKIRQTADRETGDAQEKSRGH